MNLRSAIKTQKEVDIMMHKRDIIIEESSISIAIHTATILLSSIVLSSKKTMYNIK